MSMMDLELERNVFTIVFARFDLVPNYGTYPATLPGRVLSSHSPLPIGACDQGMLL